MSDAKSSNEHEPWRAFRTGDRLRLVTLPPYYADEDDDIQAFYRDLLESGRLVTVCEDDPDDSNCPRAQVDLVNEWGVTEYHDFPVGNDCWVRVAEAE